MFFHKCVCFLIKNDYDDVYIINNKDSFFVLLPIIGTLISLPDEKVRSHKFLIP